MSHLKHFIAKRVPLWARMGGRKIFFWGSAQTCDMCGAHVRKYLRNGSEIPVLRERTVIGGMPREDDRCPVCHSLDRMRLIRLFLERETQITSAPMSILHIAPDLGLVMWIRSLKHLDYTGSDLSRRRYRHVPNFRQADLTGLPFEDDRFDVVICSHVLEHVPDDSAAMSELHRVTKPGGIVLALTPLATDDRPTEEDVALSDPTEQERRFGQWDHVRLYHRDDFIHRLKRSGFDVSLWDAFAADPDRARAWHLNPDECLPVCRKKVDHVHVTPVVMENRTTSANPLRKMPERDRVAGQAVPPT